jgi:hypothetical protein
VLLSLLLTASRLVAETDSARLERAKALFREGNALLSAGDAEHALERFLQSRQAVASGKNTANAAICLERLGRYDEALEMYEELLSRFFGDLDQQDREKLAPIMASLRARLGSLDVSSNVEGLLIVDGKPRGHLPRTTALRVLAGKRVIRVLQEGYRTFEAEVQVAPGTLLSLDATLEPLNGLGALRVEQSGREPAQLLVDGKTVGLLPWEGTLPTGPHLLQALGGARCSQLQAVRVLERKTLLIRLPTRPLGPLVRLAAAPRSASLTLDGTELGSGFWAGRLPVGAHVVSAAERGYFNKQLAFTLAVDTPSPSLQVPLQRDPSSSRWPQPSRLRIGARLLAGVVHAPSLHGGAERGCPDSCVGSASATGGRFEAALELLDQRGFGVEAALGYQVASQSFTRAVTSSFEGTSVTYALQQKLVMGGVFGRIAGVAELPLGWGLSLRSSVGAGIASMGYEASADGVAWTSGELAGVTAFNYRRVSELMPFATTTLGLQRSFGSFALGLGVGGWFVPTQGPRFSGVQLQIARNCDGSVPNAVGCAPRSDVVSGERVHGAFAALTGELAARYRF